MSAQPIEMVRLDLPARYAFLGMLGECISELVRLAEPQADHEALCYNIQLAVHEICTNIIRHAYGGEQAGSGRIEIALALHAEPRQLVVELRDTGVTFQPELVGEPALDEPQVHGYGLFIVRSLMDLVQYVPHAQYNHWILVKQLEV